MTNGRQNGWGYDLSSRFSIIIFFMASPSSEIPHAHGQERMTSPISLETAFMSASDVRASLPEQYQAKFDELREGILSFCHEFGIPVEVLKSKEVLRTYLISPKISAQRMQEVFSLFECLEYLVTNREPLKNKIPETLAEVETFFNVREQCEVQRELLEQIGILKNGFIRGIDGMEYQCPDADYVTQLLFEQRETLFTKYEQGFSRLLLVPFVAGLDGLFSAFEQFLLDYKKTHPDFVLNKNPFVARSEYHRADRIPSDLVYDPKSFDLKNHQGRTKLEVVEDQFDAAEGQARNSTAGWRILLLQAPLDNTPGFRAIPGRWQGKTQGQKIPRPDLDAGRSPKAYLSVLEKAKDDPNAPYYGESGMTPEDWVMAFMTHLMETGEPLDDSFRNGESACYLLGTFYHSSEYSLTEKWPAVLGAEWAGEVEQARLGSNNCDQAVSIMGCRFVIVI